MGTKQEIELTNFTEQKIIIDLRKKIIDLDEKLKDLYHKTIATLLATRELNNSKTNDMRIRIKDMRIRIKDMRIRIKDMRIRINDINYIIDSLKSRSESINTLEEKYYQEYYDNCNQFFKKFGFFPPSKIFSPKTTIDLQYLAKQKLLQFGETIDMFPYETLCKKLGYINRELNDELLSLFFNNNIEVAEEAMEEIIGQTGSYEKVEEEAMEQT